MIPRTRLLFTVVAAAILAVGCASTSIETLLNTDGTWKRKVEFRVAKSDSQGSEGMSMSPVLKLEDIFVLPSGPDWKAQKTNESSDTVYVAERTLKPGEETDGDVVLKADPQSKKPGPMLTNRVSIRQLAPGQWEYREVLHWAGERPKMDDWVMEPEMAQAIKKSLPPELATEDNIKQVARLFAREWMQMLFGPPDPMLEQIMFNPSFAVLRMSRHLGRSLPKALGEEFGDRIKPEERLAIVRRFVKESTSMMTETREKAQSKMDPTSPAAGGNDPLPVTMTFSVKLPGKIVETNGLVDEMNETIIWGLYDFAVVPEDVVLRAVCKVE